MILYGNENQVEKASEIRLQLRVRLTDAINRLKRYNSSVDIDTLLKSHLEALEYIESINSSAFLVCNRFYSVPHILRLKKQTWNGIY